MIRSFLVGFVGAVLVHVLAAWGRALVWAYETGSPSVGALWGQALAMPDWLDTEIVIVFAMCAGGVWVMVKEGREHRRDASERIDLHSRIAKVETAIGSENTSTIAERVAGLEGKIDEGPDVVALAERVSTLEAKYDFAAELHEIKIKLENASKRSRDGKGRYVPGFTTCEDTSR